MPQIGNGGDSGSGDDSGTISLTAGGTLTMTGFGDYTTVGNGGWGTHGNARGAISIQAHDIAMTGGNSSFGSSASETADSRPEERQKAISP